MAITGPVCGIWERIRATSEIDHEITTKRQQLADHEEAVDDYEWKNRVLLHRGKVFVPNSDSLQIDLIKYFHGSRLRGSFGNFSYVEPHGTNVHLARIKNRSKKVY